MTTERTVAPQPVEIELKSMTLDPQDDDVQRPDDDAPMRDDADGDDLDAALPPDGTEPCAERPLAARVEALLVASERPLSESRLVEMLGIAARGAGRRLADAVAVLNQAYEESGRAFRIERLAGGWQVLTRAEYGPLLARLVRDRAQSRLTPSALETLSIIAYRQPILRAEIEAIRGVACGEVLRGLMERRLVKIVGRAEELGRPMLYGTTKEFLKVFGLASLEDLPTVEGEERARRRRPVKMTPEPDDEATEATETADAAETIETADGAQTSAAAPNGDASA